MDGMQVVLWIVYLLCLYFAIFWFLVFLDDNYDRHKKKKLTKFPLVSIIVPAYNEEDKIGMTIRSIIGLDYPRDKIEILAVNDGSTDNTAKVVDKIIRKNPECDIKLINQENKGKGAALNTGLDACKGEYFICLDADSYVVKDTLKKILPYFSEDNVAAVLPLLKVKEPKTVLQKMQWFEYIVNMFYKELMSRLNCIHVAPGPFSVYRKKILQKLGGFDEDGNLTEDLEIALRLQKHHYKIIQLLDAEVHTVAPNSVKALYKQRNRWYKGAIYNAINYRRLFFNKKYGDFGLIQMPTVVLAGIIAITLISSIVYYAVRPYISGMLKLMAIDFDLLTIIKNLSFDFNLLSLNYMLIMIAGAMFLVSMVIIRKSHISTKERLLKYGVRPLVTYIFFYFFVLGSMWVGIAVDMILRRKQKW